MVYFYKNEPPKRRDRAVLLPFSNKQKAVGDKPGYADTAFAKMLLFIQQQIL
jgi:hypothetical protein